MNAEEHTSSPVIFDLPLIQQTGDIGAVLVDLMNSQTRRIQQELQREFTKEEFPARSLRRILSRFVSLEGTKQPQQLEGLQFPGISEKVVLTVLKKLVDARLLRESEDGVYELVHDTLADHLHETRDPEDAATDVAVKIVKDAFFSFSQEKTKRYLSGAELAQFNKYAAIIKSTNRLSEEEWNFVKNSERKERNRRIRNFILVAAAVAVAVVMTGQFLLTKSLKDGLAKEVQAKIRTAMNLDKNKVLTGKTAKAIQSSQNDRTKAFRSLQEIKDSINEDVTNEELVEQLLNDFYANFSLFPFYTFTERSDEAIDEIVVGDSLKFIVTSAKESPLAFYEDSFKPGKKDSMEYLIGPKDYKTYRPIRKMTLLREQEKQFILTAHSDGKIWKWQPGSKNAPKAIYQFTGRDTLIHDLAVAGDYLLVAVDSIVYELNLKSKKPVARHILGFNRAVKILVPHPKNNGQFAVVKENSNEILICQTNSVNTIVDAYVQDLSAVTSLAYSPDGRKMIAGYEEGNIAKMWTLGNERLRQIHTLFRGHRALISSIAFSADSRTILTGSWDQTAILWTREGEVIKRMLGHRQRINSVNYTKNGFAVTCSKDGTFNVWDLRPLSEQEQVLKSNVRALAVNDKNQSIAYSRYGDRGVFYLWNWKDNTTKTIRQPLKYRSDKPGDIIALSYSDDGKSIVVASENWLTTVIDLSGAPDPSGDYPYQEYRGGNGKLPTTPSVVAVDINEKYVLIADKDTKQVILRNREDLNKYQTLKHKYRVYTAKFSPDNKLVLTGCDDGNTYLWDISGDSLTYRLLKGHEAKVVAVDFSPDGKYILTGSYDNSAALYELNNTSVGSLTPTIKMEGINATFSGHTSDVNVVTFAHQVQDATYHFFTGSSDRTGKYWEYKKGSLRELPSVIRHQDEITVGGFLSGDSMIVTGGFDESLRIWRAGDDQVENLIKERIQ